MSHPLCRFRSLHVTIIGLCMAFALSAGLAHAAGQSAPLLEQELSRLQTSSEAVLGISVLHLESGRTASLNSQDLFPMASTIKVPVAVHILKLVDRKQLKLDTRVVLEEYDVYPSTYGPISDYLSPGSALTIRDLLALMLQTSDNNATDILMRVGGGTGAVRATMKELDLEKLRVDIPIWMHIAEYLGNTKYTEKNPMSPEEFGQLVKVEEARGSQAFMSSPEVFDNNPRNTATPQAMLELLSRIWRKQILAPASTGLLLDIMYGCKTGAGRLKGSLPPGTRVAHKTGTIGQSTNDVGIIDLPGGAGHVAIVVYTKRSKKATSAEREAAIAQVARAAFDYFLFNR